MTSPNLAAPHLAAAQAQKEITINDATDALDLALAATASLDCSAGGAVAVPLAVAQRNLRLVLTGAPAAAFDLVLPVLARALILRNASGQTATLRQGSGGATAALMPGADTLAYMTGTDVILVAPPVPSQVYDFGMVAGVAPAADAVMGKVVIPRAVTLPPDFAGARAHVDTAPAAAFEVRVTRDAMQVGTIMIDTAGVAALATTGGLAVDIAAGQVIRFVAPTVPDASMAGIAITLTGSLA